MGIMRVGMSLASLFHPKARLAVIGRRGQFLQIAEDLKNNSAPIIWFHCASLGEFEQARPLMEKFRKQQPQFKIVLTFFSPSGYEIRKNYEGADFVYYLPFDSASHAKQFLDLINPQLVCFVKYEFWYHMLHEVSKRNIPLILFSAIFRKDQIFFKKYGSFNRRMLHFFDQLFVQNEDSTRLLHNINVENCTKVGDTRFDRVKEISEQAKNIPLIDAFVGENKVMIVGSSWMSDMEVLFPLINHQYPKLKFIIAPHNIKENELEAIEKGTESSTIRFSQADESNIKEKQVLLIDNIGMLSSLYKYADYAYVGGSFNKGLHNTAEVAIYGSPIFIGNDETNKKFKEAVDLVTIKAAFEVADANDLKEKFERLYLNEDLRKETARLAKNYIEENLGATDRILSYLQKKMN